MQRITPPISNIWEPALLNEKTTNKRVAFLKIPKAAESFFSFDRHVYVRLQKSNKLLSPTEIVKFSYAKAREITKIVQMDKMSKLFKKWLDQGLIDKIIPKTGGTKSIKYKLSNADEV